MSPRTRRTRKEETTPQPVVVLPQTDAKQPLDIAWAEILRPNAVVQVISGTHRGWLGIIGDMTGDKLKLYAILPLQQAIANVDVNSSEVALIGQAKVASRNPFPNVAPVIREDPDSSFEQ